ncbi:twin-arginine translocase subunit TatC [Psychrobacillus sp.]|uniref:twin-arginine translocase subunit TatC n=1 Tax=Psychrobacillus sp. TaxID=1871623 RepID=UPI0028BD7C9F|nr:twin-arginine translocase subunit TatC [Psychrobacillus sp.]
MNSKDLTVIEHIEEIRKRLWLVAIVFILGIVGSFFLAKPLIHFLQANEQMENLPLNVFQVTDPVMIYLKVILFLAFVITSPVILYQLWSFVSPGLHETERRATLSYIPYSFILFLAGISFSYFVLFPFVMKFMITLAGDLGVTPLIGINDYFNFLFQITLPFGVIFQLPVALLFFTRLGFITPMMMVKVRKYAYFGLFTIAAFITPPDIMSHLLVTVPLLILYEISIAISKIGYRKYLKAEQKRQIEEQQESLQSN